MKHFSASIIKMRIRSIKGFSLMEIVVASILLALIMSGLTGVFFAAKRWMAHSRFRITGSELGRKFLEPIGFKVSESNWDDDSNEYTVTDLAVGSRIGAPVTIGGKVYTPSYEVTQVPDAGGGIPQQMRKVTVDITWTED